MPPRRKDPAAPIKPTDSRLVAVRRCWQILNAESRGTITAEAALGALMHTAMRGLRGVQDDEPVVTRAGELVDAEWRR